MDQMKTGLLIRTLRLRRSLTQRELAERLHISDRTVSKWERGCGAPDVSLLSALSAALGTDTDTLLNGSLEENTMGKNDLKDSKIYVCPVCGNVILSRKEIQITCCGEHLSSAEPKMPDDAHALTVTESDGDWYITLEHEMTREHYISFAALVCDDTVIVKKLYPEWGAELRLPRGLHGRLLWYCTQHGLFSGML